MKSAAYSASAAEATTTRILFLVVLDGVLLPSHVLPAHRSTCSEPVDRINSRTLNATCVVIKINTL